MLGAVMVHPQCKEVIPLSPELIMKQDGNTKNDCEQNSAKRFLHNLRREHPHLPAIIIGDGLFPKAPMIAAINALNCNYILGVKPGDHKYLFDWVAYAACSYYEFRDGQGTTHKFKFINDVPLNEAIEKTCRVNFLEYWEITSKGKEQHFSWVTDQLTTQENVFNIMKGGRARWQIEN